MKITKHALKRADTRLEMAENKVRNLAKMMLATKFIKPKNESLIKFIENKYARLEEYGHSNRFIRYFSHVMMVFDKDRDGSGETVLVTTYKIPSECL